MRELTLRVEDPKIKINGRVFPLLLNDLDLYTRVQALFERCECFTKESLSAEEVLATAGEAVALLEAALGESAAAVISGGKPVSLSLCMEWLSALAREAAEHYTELALMEEDPYGLP